MNNRKKDRTLMQINVRLYHGDTFVTLAKTHDVTTGGMFINTDVLRFPKDSSLDVVLDASIDNKGKRRRYPAIVVHRCLRGIGIKICDTFISSDSSSNANSYSMA